MGLFYFSHSHQEYTMQLTEEQQAPLDYVKTAKNGEFVLVDSVAGSGKTSLLIPTAKSTNKPVLYLAYSAAIAAEASKKFGNSAECRTTHSFAYSKVVRQYGMRVGTFNAKDVKTKGSYDSKLLVVESLRNFCLSEYTDYADYAKKHDLNNVKEVNKHLNLMFDGEIQCTHDFYLKTMHMLLVDGDLDHIEYDIVMLDEGGDLNPVTLEIVKLLNARAKIVVGDPFQNIFSFNNTINCFKKVKGTSFKLTKSFRVHTDIAVDVEKFCQKYLDKDMVFTGVNRDISEIASRGYITRANSTLIGVIVNCIENDIPYRLVRKASEIFKTSLMLCSLKYQGDIFNAEYRHLQPAVDGWFENEDNAKNRFKTPMCYVNFLYGDNDPNIRQGVNVIRKLGKSAIFQAYKHAKDRENAKDGMVLLTAHSSKGLEFDEVTIGNDLNGCLEKIKEQNGEAFNQENPLDYLQEEDQELFRLYYVACTRALKSLRNAVMLHQ